MLRFAVVAVAAFTIAALPMDEPAAQLTNRDAPIIVGHYHLNVTSVDEHLRFWVGMLGGRAATPASGGPTVVVFPDVLIFLDQNPPTGPTRGTTFDHIGFAVPDVPALTTRLVEAGYELTVGREPPSGEDIVLPTAGNYGRFSYLIGPDGVKVELVTSAEEDAPPIVHHHVHFVNDEFVAMQQWYMRVFDATLRPGQTDFFIGADLPGVGYMLNFFSWEPDEALVGTAGRAVDHIGFEVRDLAAFCERLEALGIELTQPYRRDPRIPGLATAEITDPWGTVIELTEGLREMF
jgi:catechol 2,3-dioxygenase-like lactoylglutathione lyase family enzyme